MKSIFLPASALLLAVLLATTSAAAAELEVLLSPKSKALRENIEAHVGELGDRNLERLQRFSRHAEREAAQALQALGYYQPQIRSEVLEEGGKPLLRLHIEQGEAVRLRTVEIRVEGEAAQLDSFRVPHRAKLAPGAVLNHGAYEDAKRLIRNRALRFGFFGGWAFVGASRGDGFAGAATAPAAGIAEITATASAAVSARRTYRRGGTPRD